MWVIVGVILGVVVWVVGVIGVLLRVILGVVVGGKRTHGYLTQAPFPKLGVDYPNGG